MMKIVRYDLPEDLARWVEAYATTYNRLPSEVVAEVLQEFRQRTVPQQKKVAKVPRVAA